MGRPLPAPLVPLLSVLHDDANGTRAPLVIHVVMPYFVTILTLLPFIINLQLGPRLSIALLTYVAIDADPPLRAHLGDSSVEFLVLWRYNGGACGLVVSVTSCGEHAGFAMVDLFLTYVVVTIDGFLNEKEELHFTECGGYV